MMVQLHPSTSSYLQFLASCCFHPHCTYFLSWIPARGVTDHQHPDGRVQWKIWRYSLLSLKESPTVPLHSAVCSQGNALPSFHLSLGLLYFGVSSSSGPKSFLLVLLNSGEQRYVGVKTCAFISNTERALNALLTPQPTKLLASEFNPFALPTTSKTTLWVVIHQ